MARPDRPANQSPLSIKGNFVRIKASADFAVTQSRSILTHQSTQSFVMRYPIESILRCAISNQINHSLCAIQSNQSVVLRYPIKPIHRFAISNQTYLVLRPPIKSIVRRAKSNQIKPVLRCLYPVTPIRCFAISNQTDYSLRDIKSIVRCCCCCCFLHINRSGLNHTQ